jgi:ABC-type uncharacterized transport system auxiliary subunit
MKTRAAQLATHRIWPRALLLAATGILSACGASRPVKYYVLDVEPLPAGHGPQFPISLIVGRITTNELYRADRLVYGWGAVQLGTYEYERWAAPPADMVQTILIAALRSTGQYRSVSRAASSLRGGDYIVRGRLLYLYEEDRPAMEARFSLQLELFDPKAGMTLWSDSYSHDQPIEGKKIPDVVEALDKNVRAGMQQLTENLSQYFAAHPPQQRKDSGE